MNAFSKISNFDVSDVIREIGANNHLFGQFNARKEAPGSPHSEMTDIWARYGDISEMIETGDYSAIADEHDSIWLQDLPAVKSLCLDVMCLVRGERLGGVLITCLPPGGKIAPHKDAGWHAEYYDKFYIPIKNAKGAVFCFEDGVIDPAVGDVWQFDNSNLHWVENNSNQERIALIICIKHDGSEI